MNEPVEIQEQPSVTKEATTIKLETISVKSSSGETSKVLEKKVRVEEISIGSNIIDDIKQLINQANVRRLIIKTEDGNTLLDIPLSAGVVGGAVGFSFFPLTSVLGSVGLLATHLLFTRLKIVVEREE